MTSRIFDTEDRKSVKLLNEAALVIADRMKEEASFTSPMPLVMERDSKSATALQAADVAAGWARELIDLNGITALAVTFERVWVNGTCLK